MKKYCKAEIVIYNLSPADCLAVSACEGEFTSISDNALDGLFN